MTYYDYEVWSENKLIGESLFPMKAEDLLVEFNDFVEELARDAYTSLDGFTFMVTKR